jgi:toxin ParE1/3/4
VADGFLTVRWLKAALDHLAAIYAYIARENEPAAVRVSERIMRAARHLEAHPRMGREGRVEGTRELVLTDIETVIAYRINGNVVKVLGVYRRGQQWPPRS